jgi:large subunit ribosomal protein L23
MNQERLYKVLLGPIVSEKATRLTESSNQIVFKVTRDAEKPEIKAAIEKLFEVKVVGVRTALMKGKTKRTRHGLGKRSDWKKAYVRLEEGQELDLLSAEAGA